MLCSTKKSLSAANPACTTNFVQKANEFESNIWLESGSRKMNAKSLLGIMSLGIITGSTVTLSAMGPDAEAAVNALDALLQRDVY